MPIPVAKLIVTAAMTAANMAITMSRKIEGPRLDDLKFTQGDYGTPLALVWGTRRIQGNIFWAEDLTEVKRRRKTKGGKFNDYSYFGTWAVAVAGHEIDGVTRIWADTHLIYDVTGAGPPMPFDFGDARPGTTASEFVTIYTGSETQEADPRMKATVEAEQGVGSTPAYRGTAYVMFKDVPLEKFGNRIPQMTFEVVNNASAAFPFETFALSTNQPSRLWGFTYSNDFQQMMWSAGLDLEVWDVSSRTQITATSISPVINLHSKLGYEEGGTFLAVETGNNFLNRYSIDGVFLGQVLAFGGVNFQQQEVRVLIDGYGAEHWATIPFSTIRKFYFDGLLFEPLELFGQDWKPSDWFVDHDGSIWLVARESGTGGAEVIFYRMVEGPTAAGPSTITVTGLIPSTAAFGECYAVCAPDGNFVLGWRDARLHRISPADGTILTTVSPSFDVWSASKQFANYKLGSPSLWMNTVEYDLDTLAALRTVTLTDWLAQDADGLIYSPVLHALVGFPQFDQEMNIRYLDRVSSAGVTLASVITDIAGQCNVEGGSFAALDQSVAGWSAVRGSAAAMVEPLLDVYDSEIAPIEFSVTGVKRHGVAAGTLNTAMFVPDGERYSVTVRQAAELPRSLTMTFANLNAEQQPNAVRADRPLDATGARGEEAVDMTTLALLPDDARDLGDRFFRRIWNSRREGNLGLTRQELALVPTDVRALEFDGEEWAGRLIRATIQASGRIATEWVYDDPSLATLGGVTGAEADGHIPSVIIVPVPSRGFVLDIPLLRDSDDTTSPMIYTGAGQYAAGSWPGAVIYEENLGEFDEELAAIASSEGATWGFTTAALGNAAPFVWDRGNVLNIEMKNGTLSGASEDAIDANPRLNLMLVGSELVQFTTAALQGDGSYNVSGFKRARRGTEWAVATHGTREVALVMDTPVAQQFDLSEVGETHRYKTITSGRADGTIQSLTLTGASMKPYAPANVTAQKKSNGDWVFAWNRRTRLGGGWALAEVPLGEASEAYELVLGDGVTSVTKTASSEAYTWTSADQTTDTGSDVAAGELEFAIYQMSANVGRGFAASGTA